MLTRPSTCLEWADRDLGDLEAAMAVWSEQGKAEGLVQGRAEGRAATLVSMARQRFG